MQRGLAVDCALAERINVAFYQNAIPVISEIVVENSLERDVETIDVILTSEPAAIHRATWRIERLVAGGLHHISLPDLKLDAGFLSGLKETVRGELRFTLLVGDEEAAHGLFPIEFLPPSQWGGSAAAPELLAAFVRPNDPAIDLILRDAAERLAAAGRLAAIDGYRSEGKRRPWEIAEAIWSSIAARGITYVLPPASFERQGQKVRGPSDIWERRVGTCLDTSLLLAACLEQAGLNPLIVLTSGHAFVGLWLKDEGFGTASIDEVEHLRKRRDLSEIVFIETTLLTATPPARFVTATSTGASHLDENAAAHLEVAVDIRRARAQQIKPLNLDDGIVAVASTDFVPVHLPLEEPPAFDDDMADEARPETFVPEDRLERWKRKLLDLTLRNKLLNFKDARKAVTIECADPAHLEDLLAAGRSFKLLPRTDMLDGIDERSSVLFSHRHNDDGRRRYIAESIDKGLLHTEVAESDLDGRLTELYRLARTSFEEGGSNILFLALGFLKWAQKDHGPVLRAPILLIPVALKRTSVRSGYSLVAHDEEARINPTLLEMLRQDFELRLPELESDLPLDASGIDLPRIWRIMRTNVLNLKGWEVTDDVVLSTFSFTKYLMWKDLVERAELLKRNPVVRHLIDTPKQSYGNDADFPEPRRLDQDHRANEIFAPLSADSSQLAAVMAAASGKDFVLYGPPGTGKSQTIANLIAQCLAQHKTILFVSQKTAALEVVHRRLRSLGLNEYCLEVHSTKAQKSEVLAQLKTAWHERSAADATAWSVATTELQALRDELNALTAALHRPRGSGLTAYKAFGLTVRYRHDFDELSFNWHGIEEQPAAALRDAGPLRRTQDHGVGGWRRFGTSPRGNWCRRLVAAVAQRPGGRDRSRLYVLAPAR